MQATNQPTHISKVTQNVENESQWMQFNPSHIHHPQRILSTSLHKRHPTSSRGRRQIPQTAPRQTAYWHKHIFTNLKQLGITHTKMYRLLGHKSKFSTSNKILIYKAIFMPIWTYRIQLWGTTYINPRMFPFKDFVHNSKHTLLHTELSNL
jgi:hypothetical protein